VSPARLVVTGGSAAFPIRDFLTRTRVDFEYRDDDGPAGVAVCTLDDGTCLTSPTLHELARHLGLLADPSTDVYDVAIIGAGPAGLAAAVYAASEGLRTAVLEREAPGGQAGTSASIDNYLGFPGGISGAELAERAREQALDFGVDMLLLREVVGGGPEPGLFRSELSDGSVVRSRCVLLATGVAWRRLDAPGLERLLHCGVYYGSAISEAPGLTDKDVFVIGGGNSAGQAAIFDPALRSGPVAWDLDRDPYPLETSQPGLFAAGDVRHGSTKRVSAAVGEGAMAVGLLHLYLAETG
jgi:thioredoxin reductase (NADPH)